jgi:hypothetical protein
MKIITACALLLCTTSALYASCPRSIDETELAAPASSTPIYSLPEEALVHLSSFLFNKDLGNWSLVSRRANAIATSSALVLSKEIEDLKEQIVATSTIEDLYYKALRTRAGIGRLTGGFQALFNDNDKLESLGCSVYGAEKFLYFKTIITRRDIFSILEKVYTSEEQTIDLWGQIFQRITFEVLINRALSLWLPYAEKNNAIAQFRRGKALLCDLSFVKIQAFTI